MRKFLALFLLTFMLFSLCSLVSALDGTGYRHEGEHVADIDFFTVDWKMTKEQLENMLDGYRYYCDTYEDGSCRYVFWAYFAGHEAYIYLYFDKNQCIEDIWLSLEVGDSHTESPLVSIALLSSRLGMPSHYKTIPYDTTFTELHDILYTWQAAVWPVYNETIYVYDFDSEIYYTIDEDTLELEIEPSGMAYISVYPSSDYDWVIDHYGFSK